MNIRSVLLSTAALVGALHADPLAVEKSELKLGFIKLTDCAPIVIAKEKGFFEDEGLQVEVIAQSNWKVLLDNVITGNLDGAHMLSGQPIAATIGIGTEAHVVTPFTMDLNGNGITVSNSIWEQMQENDPSLDVDQPEHPISSESLKPIVEDLLAQGEKLQMGMVFPVSTHNYELRYWLAASGIHPGFYSKTDLAGRTDAEVELSVTPPPQMPATLEAGTISGYCVGEPWNQQAVTKGIGVPVTTNYDIWKNNPEKVFGVTRKWADENPNTLIALTKALIRAGKWLDETEGDQLVHREEACRILSQPNYVGADYEVIKNSMTGTFIFQKSDVRDMPDFNVFFKHDCTYPWYSDGVWFLTQMRRWGQITEAKPASWYHEIAKKVYLPEVYLKAAEALVAEGHLEDAEIPHTEDGYKPATTDFIDGNSFDGHKPIEYLNSFQIGIKDDSSFATK
ncbi:nitrate/nitrite transport system substrate-binding protein [Haloferula luteola]|uniref:Nitrate/nitrite transport system substrate-binding protein n=1 Tax=Haloferula luteola TaxID=595692 RepID=A0A840V0X9_9BACT|nr:CmpA/NrtA family ABC transporter substrate-binding protein [Haloferula luteola]MBB5350726.1 nitrate/nitrite transport system substrate-binding protein [Haloferula luteola]